MLNNAAIVHDVLTRLASYGVREFCVAAGARNAQFITTLQASSGIKLWHFFEERCAGFFALGRMMHELGFFKLRHCRFFIWSKMLILVQ